MNYENPENTYAICYLHRAGDERNKCILTSGHLIIIKKGKRYAFELEAIEVIIFSQRKMLLPLVAGGVVASLTILAIFNNIFNGWYTVILLFAALFALYAGWLGYAALTVKDAVHYQDFRLNYISKNLEQFVNFANRVIKKKDKAEALQLFHVARRSAWKEALQTGWYVPESLKKDKFIHASESHQLQAVIKTGLFSKETEWVVLTIDPFKVRPEIKYERGVHTGEVIPELPANELFPHIYGPLNTDAVIGVETLI